MPGQISSAKRAMRAPLTWVAPLGLLLVSCGGGGATTTDTPTTEALTGTILVRVDSGGRPAPKQAIRITRLGLKGEDMSSLDTDEHTIHVAPGTFELTVPGTRPETGRADVAQRVTVSTGQEVNVTISLPRTQSGTLTGTPHGAKAHTGGAGKRG